LEVIFNLLYLIELIARLLVYRWEYFSHTFNILDGAIVAISCIDSFIVQPLQDGMGGLNLAILRIFRICRIFRVQKILRYTEHMGEMRVIIETLILSIQGLFWSALLMAVVIISVAVLMVQLSLAFLDDESIELERRQWLYLKFGTTARACYTMFECTFSSGWHKYSRPMIEEFSSAFGIFWCLYIVGVNFAMVRVIAAIFLKQIMFVAALDEKRKAKEMEQEREKVAADLREIFALADTSHNGAISKHEFDMMLQDHKVLSFLEKIGLEIEDAVALFNMMSLDDGEADYTEFLNGASNMKSQARAIDVVQVLHRQVEMGRELNVIAENIRALKKL
jgi:voltage-gated sodium channel